MAITAKIQVSNIYIYIYMYILNIEFSKYSIGVYPCGSYNRASSLVPPSALRSLIVGSLLPALLLRYKATLCYKHVIL